MRARTPAIVNPRHQQVLITDPATGAPRVGLYRASLVQGGALVPVALCWGCPWIDPSFDADPEDWCAPADRGWRLRWYECGVEEALPDHWFPLYGTPLSAEDYALEVNKARWDRKYAPTAPMANPRKRVDLGSIPLPF